MAAPKGNNFNPNGRPKEYDPEIIADRLEQFIKDNDQPFIQQFCLDEDISKQSFYNLCNSNKRLLDANKKALDKQELFILNNAPTGKYNPVFGIFRLKQPCFGYVDKNNDPIQVEISVVSPEERQQRIAALQNKLLEENL
ncbi:hypothetical protein [Dehalobacter restrictus]|uniref:Uncharacterized protein n=1 Tax=Dehalobacter restrictus TaxID=55583 RepID=A0A857DF38_9FIRM|nr:hypothetical protein [Dehalobacter restrictus]QGZ99422.1 hypothetical protein GQ588_01450 [Dehalobacter restrictus]